MNTVQESAAKAWNVTEREYDDWRVRTHRAEWPAVFDTVLEVCFAAELLRKNVKPERAATLAGEWVIEHKQPSFRPLFAVNPERGTGFGYGDRSITDDDLATLARNGWGSELGQGELTIIRRQGIDRAAIVDAVTAQFK